MAQGIVFGQASGGFPGVKSVQQGTLSLTGTSTTATIDSVDTNNSILLYGGKAMEMNSSDGDMNTVQSAIEFTNATTITAYRDVDGGDNHTIGFTVMEFEDGVIASNQSGTIVTYGETSETDTISTVDVDKTMVLWHGQVSDATYDTSSELSERGWSRMSLTNATTVTAHRYDSASTSMTTYYQVIEFE